MYRLSDLQAVETDALPKREGIVVEVHPERDDMGFPRVDIVADSRERLIAYVHHHWSGDEDPRWFDEYVIGRIVEAPIEFAAYVAASQEVQP